jgi:hypothetical protein
VGAEPPNDLGDGESAALALAHHLGMGIALDDGKARRICREHFATLQPITSVDLFAHAQVTAALGTNHVDALHSALLHARMRVLPDQREWVTRTLGQRASDFPSLHKHRK